MVFNIICIFFIIDIPLPSMSIHENELFRLEQVAIEKATNHIEVFPFSVGGTVVPGFYDVLVKDK